MDDDDGGLDRVHVNGPGNSGGEANCVQIATRYPRILKVGLIRGQKQPFEALDPRSVDVRDAARAASFPRASGSTTDDIALAWH